MPTQQEILFARIAVQKGYIPQQTIQQIFTYQKQYEANNHPFPILPYLIKHNLLKPEQVKEIQVLCIKAIQNTDHIKTPVATDTTITSNLQNPADITVAANISGIDFAEADESTIDHPSPISSDMSPQQTNKNPATPMQQASSSFSSSTSILKKGEPLDHYVIDKELGRGGMGVVYRAHDTDLNRRVAIKLILGTSLNKQQIDRFMQEAKAMAQLNHPNIIRVFEIKDHPQNYFVMEYIEGTTLRQHVNNKKTKLKDCIEIICKVGEALYSAHRKGIIHRDIKPSNIMVDREKEPKVMDFGLAKVVDSELSKSGDVLGTPAYMPPEQLQGGETDARADVYSLGATLYEVLTKRPPFQGESFYNVMYQISNKEPISPRLLNPDVPVDLEAVCLKCLEKEPKKRYLTARKLVEDLNNFLQNKPVSAKPTTKITHIKRWIKRNKVTTAVTLFFLLVIAIGTSYFILQLKQERDEAKTAWKEAETQKQEVQRQNKKIEEKHQEVQRKNKKIEEKHQEVQQRIKEVQEKKDLLIRQIYYTNLLVIEKFWQESNLQLINNTLNNLDISLYRNWEWGWLAYLTQQQKKLQEFDIPISCCALTPDKKNIAFGTSSRIRFWNMIEQEISLEIDLAGIVNPFFTFSPNGKLLGIVGNAERKRGVIKIWDLKQRKFIAEELFGRGWQEINKCLFYNNNTLISGWDDGIVRFYDIKRKHIKFTLDYPGQKNSLEVRSLLLSPDRKNLLVGYRSGELVLWSIKTRKQLLRVANAHKDKIRTLALSPNKKVLASAGEDKTVKIWDARDFFNFTSSKKEIRAIHHFQNYHTDTVQCVLFANDQTLISASDDQNINLWDVNSGELIKTLKGHTQDVNWCSMIDNKNFVSCGNDRTLRFWNIDVERVPLPITGHPMSLFSCTFTADGNYLASACGTWINLWDMENAQQAKSVKKVRTYCPYPEFNNKRMIAQQDKLYLPQSKIYNVTINSDTSKIAAATYRNLVVFDFSSSKLLWSKKQRALFCDFHPKRDILIYINKEKPLLEAFNGTTGTSIYKITPPKNVMSKIGRFLSCKFSRPDGKYIITSNYKGTIGIWNSKTGDLLKTLKGVINVRTSTGRLLEDRAHRNSVNFCTYSPNGKLMASVGKDERVALWDTSGPLESYRLLRIFYGHLERVKYCAFSPDSKRLVTCSKDTTLRIWDTDVDSWQTTKEKEQNLPTEFKITSQSLLTLKRHRQAITSCAFSKDGRFLVSTGEDKKLFLWKSQDWK